MMSKQHIGILFVALKLHQVISKKKISMTTIRNIYQSTPKWPNLTCSDHHHIVEYNQEARLPSQKVASVIDYNISSVSIVMKTGVYHSEQTLLTAVKRK